MLAGDGRRCPAHSAGQWASLTVLTSDQLAHLTIEDKGYFSETILSVLANSLCSENAGP